MRVVLPERITLGLLPEIIGRLAGRELAADVIPELEITFRLCQREGAT